MNMHPKIYTVINPASLHSTNESVEGPNFIKKFWERLQMKTGIMAPVEHDQMVASISHLPHLIPVHFLIILHRQKLKIGFLFQEMVSKIQLVSLVVIQQCGVISLNKTENLF